MCWKPGEKTDENHQFTKTCMRSNKYLAQSRQLKRCGQCQFDHKRKSMLLMWSELQFSSVSVHWRGLTLVFTLHLSQVLPLAHFHLISFTSATTNTFTVKLSPRSPAAEIEAAQISPPLPDSSGPRSVSESYSSIWTWTPFRPAWPWTYSISLKLGLWISCSDIDQTWIRSGQVSGVILNLI